MYHLGLGLRHQQIVFFSAKQDSKAVFSSEQTRQVLLLIASVGNTAGTQWCRENLAPIQSSWFSRDISGDQFFFLTV